MKDKTSNEINNIKNGTITEMNIIKKRIIDKSVLEFNNINYLMKDKHWMRLIILRMEQLQK